MLILLHLFRFNFKTIRRILLTLSVFFTLLLVGSCWYFPHLPQHQQHIVKWINTYSPYTLTLGKLNTAWLHSAPRLILNHVSVYEKNTQTALVMLEKADIYIDLWSSLRDRQWRFFHAKLAIDHLDSTHLPTPPHSSSSVPSSTSSSSPLIALLKQPYLSLTINSLQLPQQHLTGVSLQVMGTKASSYATFNADIIAKQDKQYRGALHVNSSVTWGDEPQLTGALSLTKGQLLDSSGRLVAVNFASDWGIKATNENEWQIDCTAMQLHINDKPQEITNLTLYSTLDPKNLHLRGSIDTLPINAKLLAWAVRSFLPQSVARTTLLKAQLQGQLTQIQWQLSPNTWQASAQFSAIKNYLVDWLPATRDVTGTITLRPDGGEIRLNGGKFSLHPETAYSKPIHVEAKGLFYWQHTPTQTHIYTQNFQLFEGRTQVSISGGVDIPHDTQHAPYINLYIALKNGQIARTHRYLPDRKLPKTVAWLKQGLLGGSVPQGYAVLHGRANQLFTQPDGFIFHADIKKGRLHYQNKWAEITGIEGEISIKGRELTVEAHAGVIAKNKIKKAHVSIPNLAAPVPMLHVIGEVKGKAQHGIAFVKNSPLNETVELNNLDLNGAMTLQLKLDIPLIKGHKQHAEGRLYFTKTKLDDKVLGVSLTDLKGQVSFTPKEVASQILHAKLFDYPVTLKLRNTQTKQVEKIEATLQGEADKYFIYQQLKQIFPTLPTLSLLEKVSGKTKWTAEIILLKALSTATTPACDAQIKVKTDLTGIALQLPAPLGKEKQAVRPLLITTCLSKKNGNHVTINYADRLKTRIAAHKIKPSEFVVALGKGIALPKNPPAKRYVITHLPQLLVSEWLSLLAIESHPHKQAVSPRTTQKIPPTIIDATFDTVITPAMNLHKLEIQLIKQKNWHLTFKAKEAQGHIAVDTNQQPITINATLDTLHLPSSSLQGLDIHRPHEKIKTSLIPQQLPSIKLTSKSVYLGKKLIGDLAVLAVPNHDGFDVKKLALTTPALKLEIKGLWEYQQKKKQHKTQLYINAESHNVEKSFLQFMPKGSPMLGGKGKALLALTWQDSPFNLQVKQIIGEVHVLFEKGQLSEVDPSTLGRLLGLLDIQHLPKRLNLDFADVFDKGLGFDIIKGDFILKDAQAITDNLIIKSPAAHILMQGRTGLLTKDYDHTLTVVPHVSNTLPIAGALAGGLGIGVATLAIQKLLASGLEQLINYQYRITGKWADPTIVSLKDSQKNPSP